MIKFPIITLSTLAALVTAINSSPSNLRKVKNNQVNRETIVNGAFAHRDMYPWFATGSDGCGGALISEYFIITTASCVSYFQRVTVGMLCREKQNCGQIRERFDVEDVFVHPLYDAISLSNDVALIKLNRKSIIEPVVLDLDGISDDYTEDKHLWVVGHGDNDHHLMHAELQFVPNSECALSYDEGDIDSSMICATATYYKGPCNGDSGGPLYDRENNILVGLISWGSKPCAEENKPSVSNHLVVGKFFIKDIVCQHSSGELPLFCVETDMTISTVAPTENSTTRSSAALQE